MDNINADNMQARIDKVSKNAFDAGKEFGVREALATWELDVAKERKKAYAAGYVKGKTDGSNEEKTEAPIRKPNFIKELEDSNTPTLKKKLDEALKLWTDGEPAPEKRGRPFKKKEPQPQGMPTPKKRGRPAKPKGE